MAITFLVVLPLAVSLTFSQSAMESPIDTYPYLAVVITHRLFEKVLTSTLVDQ